jgi:hypothetical protein
MTEASKIKIEILQKLEIFSISKLSEVLKFVKRLDEKKNRRQELLSFAGILKNFDKEVFEDLTINLHTNRAKDIREF